MFDDLALSPTVDKGQESDGVRALKLASRPVDVLREQSVKSREMHEETGAPLIIVPIPEGAD